MHSNDEIVLYNFTMLCNCPTCLFGKSSLNPTLNRGGAFKAKKCGYFGSKGPNKKSVQRKKVLEYVFWYF